MPFDSPAAEPPSPSARLGSIAGRDTGIEREKSRASSVSSICVVPELHLGFAESPTQQHASSAHLAGKVDESESAILELDAQLLELALIAVDLAGDGLRVLLELVGAISWLVGTSGRRDEVELENLLAPHAVLSHDVLDDPPDEWQCL